MVSPDSYLNINKKRLYPFIELDTKVLPKGWVLDASFVVPNIKVLPLKVGRIIKGPNLLNIKILDNNDSFVGIFSYVGEPTIEMMPTSFGCRGTLIVSPDSIDEGLPNNILNGIVDFPIEITRTKIYKKNQIKELIHDRLGTLTTGTIILEEDSFLKYEVQEVDAITDKIVISTTQRFDPECRLKIPIQSINDVKPDEEGIIKIESTNAGVVPQKEDINIIRVSSPYDLADFDPNAIQGPRGGLGPFGDPGIPGLDGNIVCDPQCDTPETNRFSGLYFDGLEFSALYSVFLDFVDVKHVDAFNNEIVVTVKGEDGIGFISTRTSAPVGSDPLVKMPHDWQILNTGTTTKLNDVAFLGNHFIVVGNTGIVKKFNLLGVFIEDLVPPTAENIIAVDTSDDEVTFAIATTDRVLINDGTNYEEVPITEDGQVTNIRFIDGSLYVLYGTGNFELIKNDSTERFVTTGVGVPLRDAYGDWVVGDSGVLLRINEDFSTAIQDLGTSVDLKAVDGFGSDFVVAVGDEGRIYMYDGERDEWLDKRSTPIKFWKSVSVVSPSGVYVFGTE